ncbi:hypothetical protein Bbelb_103960 [Branchiostoma belcheri]|nr:hypothetical protein Bbelb_103960 [Branchiostoma belcheri]
MAELATTQDYGVVFVLSDEDVKPAIPRMRERQPYPNDITSFWQQRRPLPDDPLNLEHVYVLERRKRTHGNGQIGRAISAVYVREQSRWIYVSGHSATVGNRLPSDRGSLVKHRDVSDGGDDEKYVVTGCFLPRLKGLLTSRRHVSAGNVWRDPHLFGRDSGAMTSRRALWCRSEQVMTHAGTWQQAEGSSSSECVKSRGLTARFFKRGSSATVVFEVTWSDCTFVVVDANVD